MQVTDSEAMSRPGQMPPPCHRVHTVTGIGDLGAHPIVDPFDAVAGGD